MTWEIVLIAAFIRLFCLFLCCLARRACRALSGQVMAERRDVMSRPAGGGTMHACKCCHLTGAVMGHPALAVLCHRSSASSHTAIAFCRCPGLQVHNFWPVALLTSRRGQAATLQPSRALTACNALPDICCRRLPLFAPRRCRRSSAGWRAGAGPRCWPSSTGSAPSSALRRHKALERQQAGGRGSPG